MSKPVLKKLSEQVIVITGASSGIGLTTARHAVATGAKVVLTARNGDVLQAIERELQIQPGSAVSMVADVSKYNELEAVAQKAASLFGGIDTWINNAGMSIWGAVDKVPLEDHRQLFETNFWGMVNGSLIGLRYLRERGGGALINLGSELSDVAAPLQAMYSASKHAVKGFTDALRLEIEKEGVPISVTLVKPAGIDTMFVEHARNYLDTEPKLPPPVYSPDVVAEAILSAAEHAKRDVFVGGASKIFSVAARLAPRVVDTVMKRTMFDAQQSDAAAQRPSGDSLYGPSLDGRERSGKAKSRVRESSAYTAATTRAASGKKERAARRRKPAGT